ncbi:MAG: 16S rRNA (uracil(1498)-N(3))-methyltransferase [Planctomycetes bacterium]|nr:16S rRNA (uracil(1498)-N(3))-methyltransferase [Planctomycetota bacterium]
MNLLLLRPEELSDTDEVELRDRRALHLRAVLRVQVGSVVRAGLLGGPLGEAEVLREDASSVRVRARFEGEAPPVPRDALLLAVPRPKVLKRVLEDAAAMGFGKIALVRSWRVEKSHLGAQALRAEVLREQLLLGLEQGRRTHLPEVRLFPLFRPFVEDELEAWATPGARFLAHPDEQLGPSRALADEPLTLALGPEGGWIEYELEQLTQRGFARCSLGPHPLRVEAALAAAWGQLALARAAGRANEEGG